MSIWDDVDDIVIATPRTKVQYPSPDPEGEARMWAKVRADRLARTAPVVEEDDSDFDVTVTQEAVEFDEPIRSLASYVKLVHASGYDIVSLGHSRSFAKGKPFKTGANEGKDRPDQEIETQWLYAEKPGVGRIAVSYTIVNGVTRGNMTTYRMNGIRYGDRELKARIKA